MPRTPPAKCMALPCEKCGFATYKFSQLKTKIIAPPPLLNPGYNLTTPRRIFPSLARLFHAEYKLHV